MDQKRKSQLEKEALKLMTSYLQEHLPEMQKEFGMVYINRLKISQDLSYGDVFISSMKNQDKLTKALAQYARHIEGVLTQKLNIRKIPRIRFRYDSSGEDFQKIYDTIQETTA